MPGVPFREALAVWWRIGLLSFGGPAGQIALMHRVIVDEKRWLDEARFLHALNYCMLLPGPEAQQLATYIGWLLHGVRGGLVAGLLFILPGALAILLLSWLYVLLGDLALVQGLFFGLKAAVLAIVVQALARIAGRTLHGVLRPLIATAAFIALFAFAVPFPLVVLGAGLVGWLAVRWLPAEVHGPAQDVAIDAVIRPGTGRAALACLLLWVATLGLLLGLAGPGNVYTDIAMFFSKMALVTFGGAYAVLAYVNQQVVETFGWITQAQAVAGLALAETTPGPLVIVLQFMGFMAGWNDPGVLGQAPGAVLAALLAAWATFLPSFVFIFLGAPHLERLRASPRLAGAMAGITAAVVGVIASLAVSFGRTVLLPGDPGAPAWGAIAIALAALGLLLRTRLDVLWVIAGGALAGLVLGAA